MSATDPLQDLLYLVCDTWHWGKPHEVEGVHHHCWRRGYVAARGARAAAGVKEYIKWTRGGLKDRPPFPDDIPASPYDVYGKDKSWKGMSDFLGSKPSARYVEFWPFPKARNFARSLKLTHPTDYRKWANGGLEGLPQKPAEMPAQPWIIYRNKGWRDWDDWLGRDAAAPRHRSR